MGGAYRWNRNRNHGILDQPDANSTDGGKWLVGSIFGSQSVSEEAGFVWWYSSIAIQLVLLQRPKIASRVHFGLFLGKSMYHQLYRALENCTINYVMS